MIQHGSIEFIGSDNENHGIPITPLFPLDIDQLEGQIKDRANITLGTKLPDKPDGFDTVPHGLKGRWRGTSPAIGDVEVRVWETAQ